jgi:DNA-binding CsgD family transcriptional regulator
MGRPPKAIKLDEAQIKELASIGCTDEEIASLAGVDEATVKRHFAPLLKEGRNNLKARLRRAQLDLALGHTVQAVDPTSGELIVYEKSPHASMAIYLGKVILRQVEAKEEPQATEQHIVIEHVYGALPKADNAATD